MGKRSARGSGTKPLLSPKFRAYMYGVLVALSPVGIYYGWVTESEAGVWITAVSSILAISNGMALANVPGVSKEKESGNAG